MGGGTRLSDLDARIAALEAQLGEGGGGGGGGGGGSPDGPYSP